jgi:hypothetical protein
MFVAAGRLPLPCPSSNSTVSPSDGVTPPHSGHTNFEFVAALGDNRPAHSARYKALQSHELRDLLMLGR